MLETIYTVATLALLVLFSLFVSTMLHELGHAFIPLRNRIGAVDIYIGSYGNARNTWLFEKGYLSIYIKKNPFLWYKGICSCEHYYLSDKQFLWTTAGGPIASALGAIVFYIVMSLFTDIVVLRIVAGALFTLNLLAALTNIIPFKRIGVSASGEYVGSDGYKIYEMLRWNRR